MSNFATSLFALWLILLGTAQGKSAYIAEPPLGNFLVRKSEVLRTQPPETPHRTKEKGALAYGCTLGNGKGPFGERISATGPKAQENPWRWATKYLDAETGLYHFGHRYHDPITGQFTSRDPEGERESINPYQYGHGDPINKIDVLGLFASQQDVDQVRVTVLLGMLGRDPDKLPVDFPQELAKMKHFPNAEKFGLLKPFGAEDYQRAYNYVQSAGQPSMRTMGWEEAEAANRPSFRNQEWIPHMTRSLNLGAANTPLLAQINSDFLLPTGAGAAGAKFLFGGMKSMLPVLATGARMEGQLLTIENVISKRGEFAFDMVNNPGPLAAMRGTPAANFAGGKYNAKTLMDELVLYRAGDAGTPLGQWFTRSPAQSVAHVRIDSAVMPQWLNETGSLIGTSPINTNFSVKIPRGATIYEGPVGFQRGVYLGGQETNQIFIPQPWNIKGVEVLGSSPLR